MLVMKIRIMFSQLKKVVSLFICRILFFLCSHFASTTRGRPPLLMISVNIYNFLRRFWNCIMLIYEEPALSQVVKLNKTKENTLFESWKKYKPRWHDHFVPPVEGGEEEGRAQEEEGIQAWRRKTF